VRSYLELARRERMNPGYVRRLMQLAFLAPDLIEGIINDRLADQREKGALRRLGRKRPSELPLAVGTSGCPLGD
jgi:hypothetical protein